MNYQKQRTKRSWSEHNRWKVYREDKQKKGVIIDIVGNRYRDWWMKMYICKDRTGEFLDHAIEVSEMIYMKRERMFWNFFESLNV